jgi:hypothetical protein
MEPMRLLVTDPALQVLRQATAWLIMTLGRIMKPPKDIPPALMERIQEAVEKQQREGAGLSKQVLPNSIPEDRAASSD